MLSGRIVGKKWMVRERSVAMASHRILRPLRHRNRPNLDSNSSNSIVVCVCAYIKRWWLIGFYFHGDIRFAVGSVCYGKMFVCFSCVTICSSRSLRINGFRIRAKWIFQQRLSHLKTKEMQKTSRPYRVRASLLIPYTLIVCWFDSLWIPNLLHLCR